MTNLYEKCTCSQCKKELDRIDLFPNDLCIDCYEKTPQSQQPYTKTTFIKTLTK